MNSRAVQLPLRQSFAAVLPGLFAAANCYGRQGPSLSLF